MKFSQLRESVEHRPTFRAVIKYQIQSLLSELSKAGEESVLLTACTSDVSAAADDDLVGSELGLGFLLERFDCQAAFTDYCALKKARELFSSGNNKRKLAETNGESDAEGSANDDPRHPDDKRIKMEPADGPKAVSGPRDSTPTLPHSIESSMFNQAPIGSNSGTLSNPNLPIPNITHSQHMAPGINFTSTNLDFSSSAMNTSYQDPNSSSPSSNTGRTLFKPGAPKKYMSEADRPSPISKCSQCDYTSKFKANVVRHERSIHGINVEGAQGPTIQYACTLCAYKSPYRSNLMRHEKNVHKLEPVQEADYGQMGMSGSGDAVSMVPGMVRTEAGQMKEPDQSSSDSASQPMTSQPIKDEDVENSGEEGGESYLTCHHCQLMFPTTNQLNDHINQAHLEAGKYDCGRCRASFSNISQFQTHMATHYVNRQEKCICGKTFQYRTSLLRHIPKCVIAKETNFQISETVLGSGVEMESSNKRLEADPGSSRQEMTHGSLEFPPNPNGFSGNFSEPGASWQYGGGDQDLQKDDTNPSSEQDFEQSYRVGEHGSEQDLGWYSEQASEEQTDGDGSRAESEMGYGGQDAGGNKNSEDEVDLNFLYASDEPIPEAVPKPGFEPVDLNAHELTIIIVDIETTGMKFSSDQHCIMPHIVQLAAIEASSQDVYSRYVIPKMPISIQAERSAKITYQDNVLRIRGKRKSPIPITDCLNEFVKWLEKYENIVIAAHNGRNFEFRILANAFANVKLQYSFTSSVVAFVDILTLMKSKFPNLKKHTQEYLISYFCNGQYDGKYDPVNYDSHNAEDNVRMLQKTMSAAGITKNDYSEMAYNVDSHFLYEQFVNCKYQNMPSLSDLVSSGIMKIHTAENTAGSGLAMRHLRMVYNRDGEEGLNELFSETNCIGKPRVTNVNRVLGSMLPKLCKYFDDQK